MSKIALSRISSLTFYKDSETLSKRGKPFPQLTCIGKPCKLYQPDVVRCVNAGGSGTDVDWKCEADLPEALRFGRVEVSCEGWSGPGDPYVLKESCALEYRLVQVPDSLRKGESHKLPSRVSRWTQYAFDDPSATIFMILWVAFLVFILYQLLKSCFTGRSSSTPRPRPNARGPTPGGGSPNWFPGSHPDNDPPPPYSHPKPSDNTTEGWRPGFWTGAALGGLGTYLWNGNGRRNEAQQPLGRRQPLGAGTYDWEYERVGRAFQPPA
ncbi:hypothetical protein EIP91_010364, partial [Steccherinum ochraceum]